MAKLVLVNVSSFLAVTVLVLVLVLVLVVDHCSGQSLSLRFGVEDEPVKVSGGLMRMRRDAAPNQNDATDGNYPMDRLATGEETLWMG